VKEARQWKVCVTPDGVTLRYVVNGIEWVATSVVFATLPPTVFVPPADMQRLTVTLPAQ
jgi:hypothetical protein